MSFCLQRSKLYEREVAHDVVLVQTSPALRLLRINVRRWRTDIEQLEVERADLTDFGELQLGHL